MQVRNSGIVPIQRVEVSAYRIPTDYPEADGTLSWNSTTLVLVRISAGEQLGLGFTYADESAAALIDKLLSREVEGEDALSPSACFEKMTRRIRNLGRPGLCSMAISAVDIALWELKSKLFSVSLATLVGQSRKSCAVYGSGGFTSYTIPQLEAQLRGWTQAGIPAVKMKVGRGDLRNPARAKAARAAIGDGAQLFVDANGAYSRKEAMAQAEMFAEHGVAWFEEPVSSDDLEGLRLLRDRAPAGMEIAAGEYGYTPWYFRRMLEMESVDVLQADATRCGGVTGFMIAAALCEAHGLPLSAHTAPSIHMHLGCAARPLRHLEYFHDHVRIEQMLFEGVVQPVNGELTPDRSRPGLGLEWKAAEAKKFQT